MARKNPFANLQDNTSPQHANAVLEYAVKGASRSMVASIGELTARANKLVEGQAVVDLEPDSVDPSFIQDRIIADDQEFDVLVEAIRENGQSSPILVRPHPSISGRYMVVFGHRRLLAAKRLGRSVRAVVKEMKEKEHVVAQGQENSARANLSYIEKALFAANLAGRHYDQDNATILAALSTDKASLSKMLSVASLPGEILQAIGAAKAIGRDRWFELKVLFEKPSRRELALRIIKENNFVTLASDERFNTLMQRLKHAADSVRTKPEAQKRNWASKDGSLAAEMKARGNQFTLALKAKGTDAKAFGNYLSENLSKLYDDFRQDKRPHKNGD